jgi:hypothetical protein
MNLAYSMSSWIKDHEEKAKYSKKDELKGNFDERKTK